MPLPVNNVTWFFAGATSLAAPPNLGPFLEVLERRRATRPTHWQTVDGPRADPYDHDAILAKVAAAPGRGRSMQLYRRGSGLKMEIDADLGPRCILEARVTAPYTPPNLTLLIELLDELATALRPDFLAMQLWLPHAWPPPTDRDRDTFLMSAGSDDDPGFVRNGPGGLGAVTWLGPHLVALFGRDHLLMTPGEVRALDWGGVRVRLLDLSLEQSPEELLGAWRAAMAHLRPAGVFADVRVDPQGRRTWTRGAAFVPNPLRVG